MLHQHDSTRIQPESNGHHVHSEPSAGIDIQRELNRLEEIILESPRVPLSGRVLMDEKQLLEQVDLIRNLALRLASRC